MSKKDSYHHGDLKNALIQAGVEILSQEGIGALSLRKVARVAGVSHAAPYAHFADKQALIAAISTAGYTHLFEKLSAAVQQCPDDPAQQLRQAAQAYLDFALAHTDQFKIITSGAVAKEQDYPDLVEITNQSFALITEIVCNCQAGGRLRPAPPELMAVTVWSAIHGLISLALEDQVSRTLLDEYPLNKMLDFAIGQILISG